MVAENACPNTSRFQGLIQGDLPETEETALVSHIDQCERCRHTMERLAPARDELLPPSVNGAELEAEKGGEGLKQTMNRLHASAAATIGMQREPADDGDVISLLTASDRPGSLGRLGPYEVTEVIGRGGMGAVIRAIDTTLDRIVAVKVLSQALASNGTARKRFLREARSAAAVVHDHVITIHAVDEINHQPYLVMQFVSGMSLQEKLDSNGPPEVKETVRIGKQIAAGLAEAHKQGLVHRDIKPSNILLENGVEKVKITDFGLARAVDDATLTRSEIIAGTPQYMAPEQADGEPVDHRADLFSLGSVLYAMCTGRPPFRKETTIATLRCVSERQPRPIVDENPDIPEWLARIIERLHEKDPSKRYQSAADVEDELGRRLASLQQPSAARGCGSSWDKPKQAVSKHRSLKPRGQRALIPILAGVFLLLVSLGLTEVTGVTNVRDYVASVLRIATAHGTVVLEVLDPEITVTLDGEEVVVQGAGTKELRLKPGAHEFRTIRNGIAGKSHRVTVDRGGRELLRIDYEKTRPIAPAAESQSPEEAVGPVASPRSPDAQLEELWFPGKGFADVRRIERYGKAIYLEDAIAILHEELEKDGKGVYVPLLSQQRVLAAIDKAMASRESILKARIESGDDNAAKSLRYFTNVIKPVLMDIRDRQVWVKNCYFDNVGEGLRLRLDVETPGDLFDGFGLPIVDVHFGGWSDESATSPKYDGRSLRQWLAEVAIERKPERLAEAVRALTSLADEESAASVTQAIFSVVRRYGSGIIDKSPHIDKSPRGELIAASQRAVWQMPSDVAVTEILAEAEKGNHNSRQFLLRMLFPPESENTNDDRRKRLESEETLGEMKNRASEIIVRLQRLSHDQSVDTRDWAIKFLAKFCGVVEVDHAEMERVIPRLQQELPSRDSEKTLLISSILCENHPETPGLAEALAHVLTEYDRSTRDPAIEAIRHLGELGPHAAPAVPELVSLLQKVWRPGASGIVVEVFDIVHTLGEIGPAAKEALPTLHEMTRHGSVREEADEAIGKITSGAPKNPETEKTVLQAPLGKLHKALVDLMLEEKTLQQDHGPDHPKVLNVRRQMEAICEQLGPAQLNDKKLHEALVDLILEEKTLQQNYGPDHPKVQNVRQQMEAIREHLKASDNGR